MAEPFLSEIRVVSFNFAPKGWALSNGQLLPINQNQALFALLGTTYGGNGQTTFALPDLRGRTPIHEGNGHVRGEQGGAETHVLTTAQLPAHGHRATGTDAAATAVTPEGNLPAATGAARTYGNGLSNPMHPDAVAATGGGQTHQNMQPFLVLNFIIALQGIFPSQT
jgi:microcystin-dependent protein